jgi:hypothetical protein
MISYAVATLKALLHDVRVSQGNRITTGLIGTKYLFPTLTEAGGVDDAINLLVGTELPSFGYMLAEGCVSYQ